MENNGVTNIFLFAVKIEKPSFSIINKATFKPPENYGN